MNNTIPGDPSQGWLPDTLRQDIGQFNVFSLQDLARPVNQPFTYNRRDFYKITLLKGTSLYHFADKSLEVKDANLLFFSPKIPYTIERIREDNTGHFCLFTETFFTGFQGRKLSDLPMFNPGNVPFYPLDSRQEAQITDIYNKIAEEMRSDYIYKYDLIRNYVMELIHFALKLQPSETFYKHPDANSRITAVFTELLERQFPIESSSQRLGMRSAKDFAEELSVHVNHLNRAIKETTGQTTTHHIAQRIIRESKALLRDTAWNIAEIAYCLGFEEATHFNHFFKKQTGAAPSAFRTV